MMAFAAVVLSVLALLVAGASAFYTKRQADAAARTATLDAERRYEERTPTFDAWIEPVNGGGWHRLWLRLTSRQDLSAVQVEITEGEGVEFTTGSGDVDLTGRGWSSTEWRLFNLVTAITIRERKVFLTEVFNLGSWERDALAVVVDWASGGNQAERPGRSTIAPRMRSL